jgi:hypothetical protein
MRTAIPLARFNLPDRFGRKLKHRVGFRALGRTELFRAVRNALFSSSAQLQRRALKDGEGPAHACTSFSYFRENLDVLAEMANRCNITLDLGPFGAVEKERPEQISANTDPTCLTFCRTLGCDVHQVI